MSKKVCATRKSKKNPNVYLVTELRQLAVKRGHDRDKVKSMPKSDLCKLLGIAWAGKKSTTSLKSKKKSVVSLPTLVLTGRPCNVVRSKKNPTAFDKKELVALAIKHLGVEAKKAEKLTKTELCKQLEAAGIKAPKMKISIKKKMKSPSPPTKKGCIERSKMKLRSYQETLVRYLQKNRGVIAAFDTGTGKTLVAVVASQCYLDDNPDGLVVVVTPTSLQANFRKELKAYGATLDKRYEILTMGKFANKYSVESFPKNAMLIIDEAHELRTDIPSAIRQGQKRFREAKRKAKQPVVRADVAVKCAANAKRVLLLTATPMYNTPGDLINLVAMVKGNRTPLTKKKFENMSPREYCDYFRNTIMFYRNPKSKEYPEFREHYIKVIMTHKYYQKYRDVETANHHLWKKKNPWRFLTGVRQATNALDPCQKCEWAIDKIKEGQKTLVYSAFLTFGVKKLQKMLQADKIPFVEITGSMSAAERERAVKAYNNDKVNVFFITKAGGQGLDLKGTRNVILLEKAWNRPNEDQVIGRAIRYKSHTHLPPKERYVDIYHLVLIKPAPELRDEDDVGKGSADEILSEVIEEKERVNAIFRELLESVAIDAPIDAECPPSGYVFPEGTLTSSPEEDDFFDTEGEDEQFVDIKLDLHGNKIEHVRTIVKALYKRAQVIKVENSAVIRGLPKNLVDKVTQAVEDIITART